jgi:hypothetical protein
MRYLLALLMALLLVQCGKEDLLVDTAGASLPATVKLRVGQSVLLPREGYAIRFEEVTADSRCPIGVACVWEGDGAVRLTVRDQESTLVDDTLHTTLTPRTLEYRTLFIRLKELHPHPVHNVPLDSSQYIATLEIALAGQEPDGPRKGLR